MTKMLNEAGLAAARSPLSFTIRNLRPASALDAARWAFVPLTATDLGLPPTFGNLELWLGDHQKLTLPLVVPVELSHRVASLSAGMVLVSGRPLPVEVEIERGAEQWPFFACWVLVDDVELTSGERIWQHFPATVAGRPRQGSVPVRVDQVFGPVQMRFTAPPPPPRAAAEMHVKLAVNRFIRSGIQLSAVGFYGYAGAKPSVRPVPVAPASPPVTVATDQVDEITSPADQGPVSDAATADLAAVPTSDHITPDVEMIVAPPADPDLAASPDPDPTPAAEPADPDPDPTPAAEPADPDPTDIADGHDARTEAAPEGAAARSKKDLWDVFDDNATV